MKKGSKMRRNQSIILNSDDDAGSASDQAQKVARSLIIAGHWFKLDPFPGDAWRLTVRKELDIDDMGRLL